jgi:hypothetical protein
MNVNNVQALQLIKQLTDNVNVGGKWLFQQALRYNYCSAVCDIVLVIVWAVVIRVAVLIGKRQWNSYGDFEPGDFPGWLVAGCILGAVALGMTMDYGIDAYQRLSAPYFCSLNDITNLFPAAKSN